MDSTVNLEAVFEAFESAWLRTPCPQLSKFLPPAESSYRAEALRELIRIDLEYRWRHSDDADEPEQTRRTLHDYLAEFPELTTDGLFGSGLLAEEYRVRKRWGDRPDAATFLREYGLSDEHLPAFRAVDEELTAEETALHPSDPDEETLIAGDGGTVDLSIATDAGIDELRKSFGDYELLHEIARGGMGVVYKARQTKLNRIVALKMIKAGELAGDLEIKRFLAEAEAAARLDHPSIVPIYEVGEYDGLQFFSMGFVEGQGLDAQLKQGPLPPREAATLIRTVALAIQYAHDQGIVHRDLKPANVLIDADGKPRITDFGLAKNIASDSGMTATGQVMGTPGYMPPEQAAARSDEIGPLADVYSLGAMLYALLTGRPPFQAANVMETLKQVLEREPVSPRDLNPIIDRDLETICLKCLEKDAGKRYETADDLAADLSRFLDNRPILARPVGRLERTRRWCKRNPLGTTVAGLLTFLAVAGPTVAGYQIDTNRRLDQALAGEIEQREEAETNEKAARESERRMGIALAGEKAALARKDKALLETMDSIDAYVKVVKNAKLLKDPRFKGLLRRLLKDALAHYKRFVNEHKDEQDEKTRLRLAEAFDDIGIISAEKGDKQAAIDAYLKAQALYDGLLREKPDVPEYLRGLANSHLEIGSLYGETGKPQQALAAFRESLKAHEQLVRENPDVADYRNDLASVHGYRAGLYIEIGKLDLALTAYRKIQDIVKKLARENPKNTTYRRNLASSHHSIGMIYQRTGKPNDALKEYEALLPIRKRLVAEFPKYAEYQSDLASCHNNLGILYSQTGRLNDALTAYSKVLEIRKRLTREHPTVSEYQNDLATCHTNIGAQFQKTGKLDDALDSHQSALAIQEKLVRENPTVTEFRAKQALSLNCLGSVYKQIGKPKEALKHYRKSLAIVEKLARDNPKFTKHLNMLAATHQNLGLLFRRTKKPEQALSAYRKALPIQAKLARENPDRIAYQRSLANSLTSIGLLHQDMGKPPEALIAYQKGLAIQQKLARDNPTIIQYQKDLVASHNNIGNLCRVLGRPQAALNSLETAMAVLQAVRKKTPSDPKLRGNLQTLHYVQAVTLGDLSRHGEATKHWRQALKLDSGPGRLFYTRKLALSMVRDRQYLEAFNTANPLLREKNAPNTYYDVSCVFAIASGLVLTDSRIGTSQKPTVSGKSAARAMNILEVIARAGYFKKTENLYKLRNDPNLNPLRHRDDFRALAKSVGLKLPAWAVRPRSANGARQAIGPRGIEMSDLETCGRLGRHALSWITEAVTH